MDAPYESERSTTAFRIIEAAGKRLEWIKCGLCVDERGAGNWITGPRRGGPADFVAWVEDSDQTIVIPTA